MPWGVPLRELTTTTKLLFSATLMTIGMGYVFAITNVGLAVGLTPVEVVEHYWGNEATRHSLTEATTLTDEDSVFAEPVIAIPSFERLVAEGHFHTFGFAMIFFICGFIVSFAEINEILKRYLIILPFVGSVFDVWSTFFTRFLSHQFSWMLMFSGALMGTSFLVIFAVCMKQMWFSDPKQSA
jgi:hypothetical protein